MEPTLAVCCFDETRRTSLVSDVAQTVHRTYAHTCTRTDLFSFWQNVFRVSHVSSACGMLRTEGSQVIVEKSILLFMVAELLDSQEFRNTFRTFGLSSGAIGRKTLVDLLRRNFL